MHCTIDLGRPTPVEHEVILETWRWFKARIEKIHGCHGLPDAFTPDEGEIKILESVAEDDPRYDHVPAEFNYDSRAQTLHFVRDTWFVKIHILNTSIGDYFSFELVPLEKKAKVSLLGDAHGSRLELDDESAYFAAWKSEAK